MKNFKKITFIKNIALVFGVMILLSGCQNPADFSASLFSKSENAIDQSVIEQQVREYLSDQYMQQMVLQMNEQIKAGTLSTTEAQKQLQAVIRELQDLNDGSIQSILQKIKLIDPNTSKLFEEKIRENHPNLFKD